MKSQQDELANTQVGSGASLTWAVFISGHGSNLQALIDADPKIKIELVISSRADAYGLERAKQAGIATLVLPKSIDWEQLSSHLTTLKIDRLFLAGFMKVIPAGFIAQWPHKILNLHPSLLPAYKGLKAIERSFEDNAAMGVSVHWVTPDLDGGPILLQKEVYAAGTPKNHSFETVEAAIHKIENQLVVEAVKRCQSW